MHILHVTTSFPKGPDDFSGVFVYRLIKAQVKHGATCKVLCPYSSTADLTWPPDIDISRFQYTSKKSYGLTDTPGGIPAALKANPSLYLNVPNFLFQMARNIINLSRDVDLIHAHWSICGAMGALVKTLHKRPVVTTVRGSDIHRAKNARSYNLLHKLSIKGSSAVVCVSNSMLENLLNTDSNYQDKFHFIPNGVDERFYSIKPHETIEPPIRFLFIGSLIELKQVDLLITALSMLGNSGQSWRLTVAGDGPQRSSLERLCKKLSIENTCTFLGQVPPSDVPDIIAKHHVIVLPSRREGRPNVILEAMAAARLVIASDIPPCRELIQHKETGLLFDINSPSDLYQTLKDIFSNMETIPSIGINARNWMIAEGLTWDNCAQQYIELYKKILEKS